ncbi:hypothetical protein PYCCODRAFT_1381409 [Trametes coccinea BRFM310]|uniref:BIR-domain-containing protein n=1 Tax=Trametes coccinea (strain BRFM310) TaxID=1353009 RepID=A0A1Y2J5L0_TRAC3|nr:hypothetical protein PYCCODRAFT_1381409 [Trametes coccinea BRFM310]
MEYFQSRLDSFFSPSKPKRTKASSSKQASPSRWPHPPTWKATPNSLAEAGFYYTPGPHDPDNVTCFMCKKSLGSWEPEDDPFEIHYAKCGNVCAWAALRCQKLQENGGYDPADPARHPTSKAMVKARLDTFGITKWPYDAIDGHGANSKALARAGFVWSAAEPGDDTVICLYCNLSLSGWDAEDDPYQEHLKRDKKNKTPCAFLKAYAESSLSKSTAKRPSSKATAKTSRSASQTIRANHVETMDDSEDELAAAPSSGTAPSRASSARASKSRSSRASSAPVKTPASRRSTRGTSTGGKTPASRHAVSSELEDTDVGSESETGKRTSKSKRKAGTRSKARVSAIAEEEDEEAIRATQPEEDVDMQDPEDSQAGEQTVKGKRKRGRPKTATVSKAASSGKTKEATPEQTADEAGSGAEAAPPPATTKKTHARTRSKAVLESDTDVAAPPSSKPTHTRTKSSSKTKVKQEEEVEVLPPAPAPKRKGKQKAAVSPVVDDDRDSDAPPPAKSKSKNFAASRPKTKPEPEDEDHPSPDHAANVHQVHEDNPTPAPQVPRTASRRTPSLSDDAGYATAEPPADPDRMDVDGEGDTQPASGRAGPQAASQRTTSRSATRVVDDAQVKRPSPVLNGAAHESSAPSSRASSTRPLGKMSSQKSAVKDSLKVIEIDSDAEEEVGPKPRPTEKDAPVNGLKRPASKSGKKLQVEAVAPLKTTHHSGEKDDVFLHNASPTSPTRFEHARSPEAAPAEVKSEPPGTPVSAVHRSAQVSPAHPQPVQSVDVQSDVDMPEQETSTPASPRTYHPVLAQVPIEKLNSLTEEEANMTLEQYIRREMELQYAQFKADAERRIEEFKQRAAEARKLIETS